MTRECTDATSYTPGPWTVEHDGQSLPIIMANAEIVALARETKQRNEKLNARLIAAAPDLLAALEELTGIVQGALDDTNLHGLGMDSFTLQPARAAIAKALGKS